MMISDVVVSMIDDAYPAHAGDQRRKPERRTVHCGNHAGNVELLTQLPEYGPDAETAHKQCVAEGRGVGESIPPELTGDQWGRTHTLFCTSKEDPDVGSIAERLTRKV